MISLLKLSILSFFLIFSTFSYDCVSQNKSTSQQNDWLISGEKYISKVIPSSNGKDLLLTNGLVERSFRITPNFATTAIKNLLTGQSYLRAVRAEAQITVSGQRFNIGGLSVKVHYEICDGLPLISKWITVHNDSDIIHLRRADGEDWDGHLHVNPSGPEKGLLMLYNPLEEPVTRELKIPVYYTGLSDTAQVAEQEGSAKTYFINRDYEIVLKITIPAKGYRY